MLDAEPFCSKVQRYGASPLVMDRLRTEDCPTSMVDGAGVMDAANPSPSGSTWTASAKDPPPTALARTETAGAGTPTDGERGSTATGCRVTEALEGEFSEKSVTDPDAVVGPVVLLEAAPRLTE